MLYNINGNLFSVFFFKSKKKLNYLKYYTHFFIRKETLTNQGYIISSRHLERTDLPKCSSSSYAFIFNEYSALEFRTLFGSLLSGTF